MARVAAVLRNTKWVLEQVESCQEALESVLGGSPSIVDVPGVEFTLFQAAEGVDRGLRPTAVWFLREKGQMDFLRGQLVAFGPLDEQCNLLDADAATILAIESVIYPFIPNSMKVAEAS